MTLLVLNNWALISLICSLSNCLLVSINATVDDSKGDLFMEFNIT